MNPDSTKYPDTSADPQKSGGPFPQNASPKGMRYTDAQRQEVVDFVNSHNAIHGRGGQSEAARKYNLSLLTVAAWLKKSRVNAATTRTDSSPLHHQSAPSGILEKVAEYMEVDARLRNAEAEIAHLRARRETLAAFIRGNL